MSPSISVFRKISNTIEIHEEYKLFFQKGFKKYIQTDNLNHLFSFVLKLIYDDVNFNSADATEGDDVTR